VLEVRIDLVHFGEELSNFAATTTVISNLDRVISVDTGRWCVGKTMWVILPCIPDWRWMLNREDSPWYPTARLFRQDNSRTWEPVTGHVYSVWRDFVRDSAACGDGNRK